VWDAAAGSRASGPPRAVPLAATARWTVLAAPGLRGWLRARLLELRQRTAENAAAATASGMVKRPGTARRLLG
jgi:hypothetical protein